jgi:hypothetical protein
VFARPHGQVGHSRGARNGQAIAWPERWKRLVRLAPVGRLVRRARNPCVEREELARVLVRAVMRRQRPRLDSRPRMARSCCPASPSSRPQRRVPRLPQPARYLLRAPGSSSRQWEVSAGESVEAWERYLERGGPRTHSDGRMKPLVESVVGTWDSCPYPIPEGAGEAYLAILLPPRKIPAMSWQRAGTEQAAGIPSDLTLLAALVCQHVVFVPQEVLPAHQQLRQPVLLYRPPTSPSGGGSAGCTGSAPGQVL